MYYALKCRYSKCKTALQNLPNKAWVRPDKSHRPCVQRRCRLLTGCEASPVLVKVRLPRVASRQPMQLGG